MNRRSPASSTNPAPTGAACACTVGRNVGPTPERHIARTMASANRFCAPSFLRENIRSSLQVRIATDGCASQDPGVGDVRTLLPPSTLYGKQSLLLS